MDSSKYLVLEVEGTQYMRICYYETVSDVPIYYLFYNPFQIPYVARLPWEAGKDVKLEWRSRLQGASSV